MADFLFVEHRYLLQYLSIAVLVVVALRTGDPPERLIAYVFAAAVAAEWFHWLFWPHVGSEEIDVFHAVNDGFMFIAFAHIAMRANRIYPLWILAAQLIATLMHFQRVLFEEIHPLAYWALIRLPFYLQTLAFTIGLWANHRRRKKGVLSKPWRDISRR